MRELKSRKRNEDREERTDLKKNLTEIYEKAVGFFHGNQKNVMILAGALSDTDGVGFAVMNRMLKSAGYNIVRV